MNNSKDSAATIDQENAKATDATTDYLYNTRNPATDTTLDYPATRPNSQRDEHVKASNCSADAPSRSSFDEDEAATAAKTTAASKTTATTTATTTVPESAAPIVYRRPCPQRCVAMADMTRRVSFPENDKELVTGCLEPANPWEYAGVLKSVSELCDLYIKSCHKHGAKPLPAVLKQLSLIDLDKFGRHCTLSLGSIKLTPIDCEPLEEIFKRIQFKSVDFSSCELDEGSVGALFEMIEYYEATSELDISSNTAGMTQRGWQSCSNMVGRTQELTVLIAKGNPISMLGSGCLGRALNTSNLHTLKLEHCGLKGPPLTELCIHLHKNDKVRELWLSNNDLDCKDAGNLGDLLKANHYIEFLDISNNNVTNVGLLLIVLALKAQSKELTRLSKSPEVTPPPISVADAIIEHRSVMDSVDIKSLGRAVSKKMDVYSSSSSSRLPHVADIFPESPVRFSSPLTNVSPPPPAPAIVGQSMLDKLLSMNNEAFAGEKTDVMPATLSVPATVAAVAAAAAPAVTAFSEEAASGSASESKVTPNATATTTTTATTIQAPTSQTTANDYDATTDCGGNASETPIVEEPLINFTITGHAGDLGEVDQVGEAIDEVHSKNFNRSDDIDDSHSTDSAFESASEGDSSRLMSEPEFGSRRPSDSIRIENSCGEPRNGAKCLNLSSSSANNLVANAGCTPQARANPLLDVSIEHVLSSAAAQFSPNMEHALRGGGGSSSEELTPRALNTDSPPAATTATTTTLTTTCDKDVLFASIVPKVILRDDSKDAPDKGGAMAANFSTPSVPIQPPSTPTLYAQSMRLHSQSTDSLCSENSLDGSVSSDLNFSTSAQINEKLTKNDTLTRQLRQVDPPKPMSQKRPGGLKALALWNNNLTKESGSHIAQLLTDTVSLELLNIGKNCLSNEFVTQIKESLSKNTTLTTLGLQSTHLSRNGIDTLFSIFGDECDSSLKRVDIRDNKVEIENLTTVLEVLKTKHTRLTQIDIDDEPKRLPAGTDEHKQYTQILQNIRAMCTVKGGGDASETEAESPQRPDEAEKPVREVDAPRRGNGFGGRKISLTCYSRPLLDTSGKCVVSAPANEAEVKRTRMRSPLPSPPSVSPSSSPNRSRFQVFRVAESNLLNQPLNNKHSVSTGNLIPRSTTASELLNSRSTTSQSLPTMSAVKPMRSRFQVSRIYEDPQVPISKRDLPPIAKDTTDTTEAGVMRKSASPEGTRANPPPPKPESKPPSPPVEIDTTPPTPSPPPPSTVTPPPTPVASTPPSPTPSGAIIPPSSSTPSMAATSPCPTPHLAVTPPSPTPPLTTMAAPTPPPPTRSADSPTPPAATLPSVRAATPPPLAPRPGTPPPTATKQPSPPPLIEDTPPFVLEPENFVSLCDELAECNECDNEKTLTKDSVAEGLDCRAAVSAAAAASEPTKKSWISNTMPVEKIFYPAGVERLLTLFHNPFPRNASPDKVEANNVNVEEQQQQNTLVPSRKITPPSWPIFDADNLFNQINSESPPLVPGGDVVKNGGLPGATAPASAGAQSKSLLDVASRHLSDLSKQVFGPFSSTEVNPTPPTVGVAVEENVAPLARVATCTMNHDDEYERSEAADSMTHAQRDDGTGKASTQEDVAGSNPYY